MTFYVRAALACAISFAMGPLPAAMVCTIALGLCFGHYAASTEDAATAASNEERRDNRTHADA